MTVRPVMTTWSTGMLSQLGENSQIDVACPKQKMSKRKRGTKESPVLPGWKCAHGTPTNGDFPFDSLKANRKSTRNKYIVSMSERK